MASRLCSVLLLLLLFCFNGVVCVSGAERPLGSPTEYAGKRPIARRSFKRLARRTAIKSAALGPPPGSEGLEPAAAGVPPQVEVPPQSAAVVPGLQAPPETTPVSAIPSGVPESVDAVPLSSAVLPDGVVAAQGLVPSTCAYQYAQTDIRPIRVMWNSSYGYCGENALQMILLARGIWISQNQARLLAGCGSNDLILDDRTVTSCSVYPFVRDSLAFDMPPTNYWDSSNQNLTYVRATSSSVWPYRSNTVGYPRPTAASFVQWIKRQIVAGRPLLVAVRLQGYKDEVYDHIVPFFGVCSSNVAADAPLNNATDGFSLSSDFGDEIFRPANDAKLYGRWKECRYGLTWGQAGCIPSDTWNYALAIGQLKDSGNILVKTTKLVITGWSNTAWAANFEPGEPALDTAGQPKVGNNVSARYQLLLWGLTPNATYTTYRYPGRFTNAAGGSTYSASSPAVVPSTVTALKAACTKAGCGSYTFRAPAGGAINLTETSLGIFYANSLQYFLTVAGA